MGSSGSKQQNVLKKIYFIKRARKGEELTTLLKNKFKSIDAIRDLLSWFEEGRDFVVSLRGGDALDDEGGEESIGSSLAAMLLGEADGAEPDAPEPSSWPKKKNEPAAPERGQRSVVISPWLPTAQNYRNLIEIIALIISWMDQGRDFDITLCPQKSFNASLN